MPDKVFERIGLVDFFAVLMPGIYMACALSLFFVPGLMVCEGTKQSTATTANAAATPKAKVDEEPTGKASLTQNKKQAEPADNAMAAQKAKADNEPTDKEKPPQNSKQKEPTDNHANAQKVKKDEKSADNANCQHKRILGYLPILKRFLDDLRPVSEAVMQLDIRGALILLFGGYLLGSLNRTIRVRYVDFFSGIIHRKQNSHFPYPEYLNECRKHIEKYVAKAKITTDDEADAFNYWKTVICLKSPSLYDRVQACEARSRITSGMCFAGVFSAIVLGLTWLLYNNLAIGIFAIVSLLMSIFFLISLRHMRMEEARDTYFAYIVVTDK